MTIRRGVYCLILGTMPWLTGCVPWGVSWLSDSSGFVFTGGKEFAELRHFDMATKKVTLLTTLGGGQTMRPAVSPDGKLVAVGEGSIKDRQLQYQVVLYDLQGKEQKRSESWRAMVPADSNAKVPSFALFWSRGGDRLVSAEAASKHILVWNMKTNERSAWENTLPVVVTDTPIRPDDRGVLVRRFGSPDRLVFMDWQGKENVIKSDPDVFAGAERDHQEVAEIVLTPLAGPSTWEKNRALIRGSTRRDHYDIQVDTDRNELTWKKQPAPQNEEGRNIRGRYQFRRANVEIFVVKSGKSGFFRVDLKSPNETRVLIAETGSLMFCPAPDGKAVALAYDVLDAQNKREARMAVVDEAGKMIADFAFIPKK